MTTKPRNTNRHNRNRYAGLCTRHTEMKINVRTISLMIFFLSLLFLTSFNLPAQEKLTLKQFVETALRSNESILIAQEAIANAEAKIEETKSQYYPQVNLSATYMRLSQTGDITFPINGQMSKIKFMSPNSYSLKLGLTENIYNSGRTKKMVQMNEIGAAVSKENVELIKHNISYQLVPIFYGILFTQNAINVLDDTMKSFQQKLDIAKERYKSGLASDFDISSLHVQISTLEGQILELRSNIRKWNLLYNRTAGRNLDASFEPDDVLVFQPFTMDISNIQKEAFSNRSEMKLLGYQQNLSNTQFQLAKKGNKPSVATMLNYEFKNGVMPNIDNIKGTWSAGLSASYPVFDGFRTRAQVAQAQVAVRTVEKQKTDQVQAIELEINQGFEDIKVIEQKIEIEKIKIGHAETALRIAEERYKHGFISTTDLIDAQTALENARLNHLQLILNHTLAKFTIYKSAGRKLI